jgi:hypothetical protein
MNPIATLLRFGDLYIQTSQIERIQYLANDAVEIKTRTCTHVIKGAAATDLRTYINSYSQSFNLG